MSGRIEGIARTIDSEAFERRALWIKSAEEWTAKTDKFEAEEDPNIYPDGQLAKDRIVKAWRGQAQMCRDRGDDVIRKAVKAATALSAGHSQELLMAFECGYRAAERGENPQAALAKFAAMLAEPEPSPPLSEMEKGS